MSGANEGTHPPRAGRPTNMWQISCCLICALFPAYLSTPTSGTNEGNHRTLGGADPLTYMLQQHSCHAIDTYLFFPPISRLPCLALTRGFTNLSVMADGRRPTNMRQQNSCRVICIYLSSHLSSPMSGANERTHPPLLAMAGRQTCSNKLLICVNSYRLSLGTHLRR